MRILKIKLENFQGVKKLEVDPQGANCSIYGDNGAGKSTVYNAFTWLMYGKPGTGEKNYTPKTTGTHHLNHIVEMTLQLDHGEVMRLSKDYHEVYKTVRGSAQEVFAGHTADYAVDGVPVNETEFKKVLTGLYQSENLARMLTSYDYFLDTMKVADRRKILLEICGDADFWEVIKSQEMLEELPLLLRKPGETEAMYTVEEYRAIAAKEKHRIDKELAEIPERIDEAAKARPDITGLDETGICHVIQEIEAARREVEGQKAAGEAAAVAVIRQQIAELESQRAAGEAEYARAEAEKNKEAFARIRTLRQTVNAVEMEMLQTEQQCRECESEIQRLNRKREQLLVDWQAEHEKQWSGKEICPTCGQQLPEEQIEEAKESFHLAKSQRLEQINQRGMTECSSAMIRKKTEELESFMVYLQELRQKKEETAGYLQEAENSIVQTAEYCHTSTYAEMTAQIETMQKKLQDAKTAAAEAESALESRLSDLNNQMESWLQKKTLLIMAGKQEERIAQLEQREKELAVKYERLQKGIYLCEQFMKAKTKLLDEKINSRFETLRFRLFIEQQNGGIADDCEALIPCESGLVPFKSANHAARVNAGLELIDTLAEYYGVELPVFLDNSESVTRFRKTKAQLIKLVVSEADKTLRFERESAGVSE